MTSLSIKLDKGFSPKVKVGDKVATGQLIAEKTTKGADHEIHVARLLNVPIEGAVRYVTKRPGDRVGEGTVVAFRKGALGFGGKKVVSPVEGTVFAFNNTDGILIVRTRGEEGTTENLFSPVDGEVGLCDNEKISIKTQKAVVLAREVLGEGIFDAEIYPVKGEEINSLTLKSDLKGKIVIGKNFDREALSKSLGLGAKGIIAGKIRSDDWEEIKRRLIKTPIFLVDEENAEKMIKSEKKKIYIDTEKKTLILQ